MARVSGGTSGCSVMTAVCPRAPHGDGSGRWVGDDAAVPPVPAMKVGVLQFFSWPERRVELRDVYARALERVTVMDRAGYDAVWLAEHHFTTYSVCPSVHLMALEVAHRTTRLRIGPAVSLAALYHPLRLAEEVALRDVLSAGRVKRSAEQGVEPAEVAAFGVPTARP